jgi:hypothetical protein
LVASAVNVDEGVAVGVGLSLEEQLAIRPAVNVKIPNNFTVDFFMIVDKILFIFLYKDGISTF